MPTYSTTLDIEVSIGIDGDEVLECTVPVCCEHWNNGENDPQEYDQESSFLVDRNFVEPEWFHVTFRDIALSIAEERFTTYMDKYEQ